MMGPTENDKQDDATAMPGASVPAGGSAMPPAQGMPPAGGTSQGVSSAWPPEPAGTDPAAANPEDVSMGDEAPGAMPEAPAAPEAGAGKSPDDSNPGLPSAGPQ